MLKVAEISFYLHYITQHSLQNQQKVSGFVEDPTDEPSVLLQEDEDSDLSISNWSTFQRELKDRYNIIKTGYLTQLFFCLMIYPLG